MATGIQWTDETWNPIRAARIDERIDDYTPMRGWHCAKVSAGCTNCYAEKQNLVAARGGTALKYIPDSRRKVNIYLDENTLGKALHWRKPKRVFVCSMTDLFGEWVTDEMLDRIFAVMALTPHITYQVLTKRPERMREYLTDDVEMRAPFVPEVLLRPRSQRVWLTAQGIANSLRAVVEYPWSAKWKWPLPNVWLGTSVEDQQAADERIPHLLATPAAVRFLSCEPLLGPVGIGYSMCAEKTEDNEQRPITPELFRKLHWVIAGGESGTGARPCDLAWLRSLRDQCAAAGVPFFAKQLGSKPFEDFEDDVRRDVTPYAKALERGWVAGTRLRMVGGAWHIKLRDRHGADMAEWPEDLRVRQFPGGAS